MEALKHISSRVIPLDRANIDTDAIIPKQFLKKIERTGFGVHLFHDWRYLDDAGTQPNPDFILNEPRLNSAQILLARENFGSGSSREHAPWALLDWGIRVIIAPSFADIFYNNCFKNGILPIRLEEHTVDWLFAQVQEDLARTMEVDLAEQKISYNSQEFTFAIDPVRKDSLLQGLDDIGWTMQFQDKIAAFEQSYHQRFPWLA